MIERRSVKNILVAWGIATLLLGVIGAGAWAETSQSSLTEGGKAPRAIIKTKFGEMELVFFPDLAPKHVESFLTLARKGFYDGTIFHRVIPGFMIQGGDPNTKDPSNRQSYGNGGPGYTLPAEFNRIPHERGIVSAARAADPNSAGSQFFIVIDKAPHLDGKYTVFGEVVRGMDVADTIVQQPRDRRNDNPLERVEITVEVK